MYKECAIILLQLVSAYTRVIPGGFNVTTVDHEHGSLIDEHGHNTVEETQHAMCKISSKDLEATANATITRQLKGVCTSSHLDTRINILERTLVLEMNNIKNMLQYAVTTIPTQPAQPVKSWLAVNANNVRSFTNDYNVLSLHKNEQTITGRNEEISKYNMTIQKDNAGITFNYYWRIHGILDDIKSTEPIESGDFYFSGNHLYIRAVPNYKHTEHTFIQVVGIEEFLLTHQFSVLDQINAHYDIVSPLLNCQRPAYKPQIQCSGYQISHEILASRDFIMNNNVVIKLLIFLEI